MTTLRQLEALVALADVGQGLVPAGRRLHTTAPATCGLLARLGRGMGLSLTVRTRSEVRLSSDGEAVIDAARAVIDAVRHLEDRVAEVRRGAAGVLRVGVETGHESLGDAALTTIRDRLPGWEVRAERGRRDALGELLHRRRLDLLVGAAGLVPRTRRSWMLAPWHRPREPLLVLRATGDRRAFAVRRSWMGSGHAPALAAIRAAWTARPDP